MILKTLGRFPLVAALGVALLAGPGPGRAEAGSGVPGPSPLAAGGVCFACIPPRPVPEVDPASAVGAVTLLAGGALTLTDRLRRQHRAG